MDSSPSPHVCPAAPQRLLVSLRSILRRCAGFQNRWLRWLEISVAVIVICSAALPALRLGVEMARSSLWIDEIVTIRSFSSQGPWRVLTHYTSNNHVLFNLVNSLTPGASSFDPFRARFWSFAAVLATATLGIGFFCRRKRILEAAFFFHLFAGLNALGLLLQARGYGFASLAGVTACLACFKYWEERSLRNILLLAGSVVAGACTVPTFILFGGPLMIVLLLASRDWRWIPAGTGALVLVLAVLGPSLRAIRREATEYALYWGCEFADFNALSTTLQAYLMPVAPWIIAAFLGLLAIGYFFVQSQSLAARCLLTASIVFFVICLGMQTPLPRTTIFAIYPLIFAATHLFSQLCPGAFRVVVGTAVAVPMVAFNWDSNRNFSFKPMENWKGAAEAITEISPPGTAVFVNPPERRRLLESYLNPESYCLVADPDMNAFASGKLVIVDAGMPGHSDAQPLSILPPEAWAFYVPQIRANRQAIYFRLPEQSQLDSVLFNSRPDRKVCDRKIQTGWTAPPPQRKVTMRILPKKGTPGGVLHLASPFEQAPQTFKASIFRNGEKQAIAPESINQKSNLLRIDCGAEPFEAVEISFRGDKNRKKFGFSEVWLMPAASKHP